MAGDPIRRKEGVPNIKKLDIIISTARAFLLFDIDNTSQKCQYGLRIMKNKISRATTIEIVMIILDLDSRIIPIPR
jgi:hypothetical protein